MLDKKQLIMVELLSFQTSRVSSWCEKYIFNPPRNKSKKPPEASSRVVKDLVREAKITQLSVTADRILSIVEKK